MEPHDSNSLWPNIISPSTSHGAQISCWPCRQIRRGLRRPRSPWRLHSVRRRVMSRRYSGQNGLRRPVTSWPKIYEDYTDEFGHIGADVYHAAGSLWGKAELYALVMIHDAPKGHRLML